MFDLGFNELILIGVILIIFIGPKELPQALKAIYGFVSKIKVYATELRTGIETLVNESEINSVVKEIEKPPIQKKKKKK
jgi:sec-independent protein translocase protein TatB